MCESLSLSLSLSLYIYLSLSLSLSLSLTLTLSLSLTLTHSLPTCRPRHSSEGDESLNSSGAGGRRLSSKHIDRKEKFYGPPERPPSSSAAGPIEAPPTSSSLSAVSAIGGGGETSTGVKGRGRKESGSQHDHKRRKEEEGASGLESRSAGRKRKRDQVDDEPPAIEAKKVRTGDPYYHPHPSAKEPADRAAARSKEGGGSVGAMATGGGGELVEGKSSGDRKRRHDTSTKDGQPPRKHLRSRSPDTPRQSMPTSSGGGGSGNMGSNSSRRHGSSGRTSVTSPNSKKTSEHHHRSKATSSSKKVEATAVGHDSNDENESMMSSTIPATADVAAMAPESVRKKLDWASVSSYTRKASSKLERRSTSVLEKFSPGAIFARVGVSPSLAGEEYSAAISSLVSNHLKKTYQTKSIEETAGSSTDTLPTSLLELPFEGQQFASSCVSRIKEQLKWEHLIVDNVGPCRRALTASADYTIRKKLKKTNQASN